MSSKKPSLASMNWVIAQNSKKKHKLSDIKQLHSFKSYDRKPKPLKQNLQGLDYAIAKSRISKNESKSSQI